MALIRPKARKQYQVLFRLGHSAHHQRYIMLMVDHVVIENRGLSPISAISVVAVNGKRFDWSNSRSAK
jgi:hypothetical protein